MEISGNVNIGHKKRISGEKRERREREKQRELETRIRLSKVWAGVRVRGRGGPRRVCECERDARD